MDLSWYVNRLRRMTPAEMLHRVQQRVHAQLQQAGWLTAASVPAADLSRDSQLWLHVPDCDPAPYVAAADRVLSGALRVFALDEAMVGNPPQWNRCPRKGVTAPMGFGKTLNYRDETLVGDIKYLWEPNRHLHLVTLAQAYRLTGESRYLDGLRHQLTSWFEQCPYLQGPNWTSSLELAIRLINWSLVWQLLGGLQGPVLGDPAQRAFRDAWLAAVYRHAHFIAGHLSRHSSANNHVIGEAAGLFIAAVTWPVWPQSPAWRERAQRILVEEALRQNGEDGVNREQAVSYQQFVLDFLLLAALCGRANAVDFPQEYWQRIERMLDFVAAIMDVGGHVPMIGDADDGYVVRLSPNAGACPYRSLLATGAILFDRADFMTKAREFDAKTSWLLGTDALARERPASRPDAGAQLQRAFPAGGYYILGADFDGPDELKVVADAGPLGYLSIAAHGHADALAFTLAYAGHEFLVDPGTYAYHTQKRWRDYFRGTSAHNTLRIDAQDQSVIGGNFMWLQHAPARCERFQVSLDEDHFIGVHDGYRRFSDALVHRRELRLRKASRELLVADQVECAATHDIEQFWHFAEDVTLVMDGRTVYARKADRCVTLELDSGWEQVDIVRGRDDPPMGWVSRRFDHKVPASSVVCRISGAGARQFVTKIRCTRSHPSHAAQ